MENERERDLLDQERATDEGMPEYEIVRENPVLESRKQAFERGKDQFSNKLQEEMANRKQKS
ncbi:MAG: hypothetical protein A2798_00640 [Candidatus Levybacteria bacterium RIFCSPHIGHO2_01_FULL_37_17]|nr:MAG: hypothetical protein A2798_00640 [Candidatus Levybacteria bacterium RIFCSPHIGHO2_01_FULL_37_17]OGH36962.1 MAG: hypothetical protein A2959_01500 [Candidatus Levybacteria bacterium RIFCSPLOWO2_01_FULL_38_23]